MKHHCMNANLMRSLDELRGPVMAQLPWTRTEGGNMPEEPSPPTQEKLSWAFVSWCMLLLLRFWSVGARSILPVCFADVKSAAARPALCMFPHWNQHR